MCSNKALILSGFKEDCEKLTSRFEQADDIRFETFCEIWKDMKFSLIFTGRQCILELMEFCEEALHICKQFLLLPPRFRERIGGLYLLYGVYYKMPIDQFKIKVKLDDWKSISELHAEIKEAEHLDANYILCKLIADNAFHFCMFDREFGLEKHYRVKERQCFNPYSVLPLLKELTDEEKLLGEISSLSKKYDEMKRDMMTKTKSNASLILYNPNIADEVANDVQMFDERRKNEQIKNACSNKVVPGPSTSKERQSTVKYKPRASRRMKSSLVDDMDSYESDEDQNLELLDYDSVLPESFDE